MDEAIQARLFEPFFTTKEAGRGTGMGLAAVYGTVKSHQGAVTVHSEPNRGTRVTLYFPLAQSPAEPDGHAEVAAPATPLAARCSWSTTRRRCAR
jgi:signal transduction histidine kinase